MIKMGVTCGVNVWGHPVYIELRRQVWHAVLDVPKDLRSHYGKKRLVLSLKTQSKTIAEHKVLAVVSGWKDEFEIVRTGGEASNHLLARSWASDYSIASKTDQDIFDEIIDDKARSIASEDSEAANTFVQIVQGEAVAVLDVIDEWLATKDIEPKTIDTYRASLRKVADQFPYTHSIDPRAVKNWILELQVEKNLNRNTIQRMLSVAGSYWEYLDQKGRIASDKNPFKNALSSQKQKTKGKKSPKRQPFDPRDIPRLVVKAREKDDNLLADLILLGAWTGCRIEEICSLKLKDVKADRLIIVDAKTSAGNRIVPIHVKLHGTVERLRASSEDGYLLSGLTFNKYGDRSNAIGKRFGRVKSDLGFGPEFVYHSIRKTVATLLENAGVSENVASDLLGHEKQTMTYGLYSSGANFDTLKIAIENLCYQGL